VFEGIEKLPSPLKTVTSVLAVFVIGYLDYLTGYEVCFTLLYLFPIFYAGWYSGKIVGYIVAVLSGFAWLTSDLSSGHIYSHSFIIIWNFSMRLGVFILFAYFLYKIKTLISIEKELSRIDYLTGLKNSRSFYENLEVAIENFKRFKRPFTVVYIDVDDFKTVNDTFGHLYGDGALKSVANIISESLRSTDVIARMGGDEFGLILLETSSKQSEEVLKRMMEKIAFIAKEEKLRVSLSFGAVCFENFLVSEDPSEIIKTADDLMYCVKKNGKNQIKAVVY
jgi:diguanylate cyclase (GGDEF)-like protein